MAFCMNYVTVIYMVFTLPNVFGAIDVNCGSAAVVGKPYNFECTNIPATLTNGIYVFLEGESNSIIFCFIPAKNCISRNSSLYSVVSPHTTSLSFTILNVTTDDIGKKLYCVDDTTLDLSTPKPSCTIDPPVTTTSTNMISSNDNQPNTEIGVNCGLGAVVGKPYRMNCTNIPDTVSNGIHVFLGDTINSIIDCFHSKNCTTKVDKLYSVMSPHTTSLSFTILSVTTDDIGKKLYCVDNSSLDLSTPKPNCTISSDDGLSGGEIAGIVIGCIVFVLFIIIFIVFVIWKMKICCFS